MKTKITIDEILKDIRNDDQLHTCLGPYNKAVEDYLDSLFNEEIN